MWSAAVLTVLVLAVLLVVHSAPVRREVLRRAAVFLTERYGVAIRADVLDYNLFSRRVVLSGVSIAATGAPDQPFLTASAIEARLPASVFFGAVAIDSLRLDDARVAVRWRADGSSNLPSARSADAAGPPAAVEIGRLEIPNLGIDVVHDPARVTVSLPDLAVDVRSHTGHVRLAGNGRITRDGEAARITALGGGVSFDGRTVSLAQFAVSTEDVEVTADGAIALLVADPSVDLRLNGSGDVSDLARRVTTAEIPKGRISLGASLSGPIASPHVAAQLRSESLAYQGVTLSNVEADVSANREQLEAARVAVSIAGGRLTGAGRLMFTSGVAIATAQWSELSVERMSRMLSARGGFTPAGRASGAATFSGRVSDAGTWDLELSNRLLSTRAGSGLLPIAGQSAIIVKDGRWRFDGDHRIDGAIARASLRGIVEPDALASSSIAGTIDVSSDDLTRLIASLDTARLVQRPPFAITSERVDATATLSGTMRRPVVQLNASGRSVTVSELANLDLEAKAAGTIDRAHVEAHVRQGGGNQLNVTGTVWPKEARLDVQLAGTLNDASALVPGVPVSGTADLRLDARGPFDDLTARGSLSVRDARYDAASLGPIEAQLALNDDVAHVEVSAADFGAQGRADVSLGGSRAGVVDLQIKDAAIDRLLKAVNRDAALTGTLSLTAHAEGSLKEWRRAVATVDVGALEARAEALPIRLQEPARVRYDGGTLDVVSLEAALGETRLSVAGRYAVLENGQTVPSSTALRGVLVGDLTQVIDAVRAAGLSPDGFDVTGNGPVVVLARANGEGARPLVSADVELGPAEVRAENVPSLRDVRVRARVVDGQLRLLPSSAQWQGAAISIEGRAPIQLVSDRIPDGLFQSSDTATESATLDLRATSVSAAALSPWLPAESIAQIQGDLDASVHLEAAALDWERLRGEARLDRLDLSIGGLPVAQQEPTRIEIERGIAQVARWNWTGRGATLVVQGEARLPDRRAALLAGGQIDLRLLTPFLPTTDVALGGRLTPRVSIAGPFDDLLIEGDLSLADGELRLRDPRVIATGLTATATLTPDRVRITGLDGQINGGSLTGSGEIGYGQATGVAGTMTAMIASMGLEFPEGLRSEINADLTLGLSQPDEELAGALSGTVTVVRSAYREPIAVVNQLLAALRTERLAAATAREPGFADRLQLNVRVLTDSDVIVDNNLAQLQLGGDLRVIGTAAAPALSGRATLREGGELVLGPHRYTIDSGTIDFANPNVIEPDLNIQSHTRAAAVDIELTLKGTPETLSVDLRSPSDPELGQADIASLLLTGRQLNEVSGAEAQILGEQVIGYLSGDVLGAASRVVGLDTLRLGGVDPALRRRDSAEIASETDPTSRLTFGKSLGSFVDLTLSQSLRESGAQTWILDFAPIPRLDLRFVSDDENLRSYQFRHDVTFGSPPVRARSAPREVRAPQRVVTVAIEGDLGGPEDRLRRVIRLDSGDEFDFSEWQRDRDRLERALQDEGRLEARVSTRRQETADGVTITHQIDAGPQTAIRFEGYTPSDELMRAVRTAWTRAVFDEALASEAEALVTQALRDRGYLTPSVKAAVTVDPVKTLTLVIEPGPRVAGRRIDIEGDDQALAHDLERWLKAGRREEQAWRDPAGLERAIVDELRARGHISPRVVVEPPRDEERTAVIRVKVAAGPVTTISEVRFQGAGDVARERLGEAAGLEIGAPYDPSAVELARTRAARLMRNEGFTDVRVDVQVEPDADNRRAAVVFAVESGARQVLRDIRVTGNRAIDRDVIVRSMDVDIGDPLGADAWLRSRSRLFDTALFRRVDVTAEPIGDPSDGQRPMRLNVTVEEWPAARLRYGFQLSEERPEEDPEGRDLTPGLSADVTRRTLFGRALTVGGVVEYQRRERLARGFLNSPSLFDLPIESVLSVERSREEIADASVLTDRGGVAWEQRARITPPIRLSYGYQFDRDHTFSTRPSDDPLNPPFDVTVSVARLTGSAVFDTRNDPLESTRGWLVSSNIEYAAASLGSDIRFVRYLAQGYRFQPWGPVVLASAARMGLATALGGQSLIPSERFFLGGARTVRGVSENALGPRDIFGDAAGGGALVVMNQEVRFPIYRWFRGVGFVDAGNVFERPRLIDLGDLVGSFGAGLRVTTPFALLRADVARLWSPEAGQPAARWTFGIGQTF
jgi:outer membrane protein assembly factor BamA/autotransporter translocation and assembly factor TamB